MTFFRDNMITVDFGGVTVENSHTTTEIIRGMLPSGLLLHKYNLNFPFVKALVLLQVRS